MIAVQLRSFIHQERERFKNNIIAFIALLCSTFNEMMCFKRENIDLDRGEISLFNSEKRPNVFESAKTK